MKTCSIQGCVRPSRKLTLCNVHYQRQYRVSGPTKKPSVTERFYANVLKTETCWLWLGAPDPHGYGWFRFRGRGEHTQRVSWMLSGKTIPVGMLVLHTCDNPQCVRPSHLFIGTQQDNLADMKEKGRQAKGTMFPQSKLTPRLVKRIRADSRTQDAIANEIGCSRSVVSRVKNGKAWTHVR